MFLPPHVNFVKLEDARGSKAFPAGSTQCGLVVRMEGDAELGGEAFFPLAGICVVVGSDSTPRTPIPDRSIGCLDPVVAQSGVEHQAVVEKMGFPVGEWRDETLSPRRTSVTGALPLIFAVIPGGFLESRPHSQLEGAPGKEGPL